MINYWIMIMYLGFNCITEVPSRLQCTYFFRTKSIQTKLLLILPKKKNEHFIKITNRTMLKCWNVKLFSSLGQSKTIRTSNDVYDVLRVFNAAADRRLVKCVGSKSCTRNTTCDTAVNAVLVVTSENGRYGIRSRPARVYVDARTWNSKEVDRHKRSWRGRPNPSHDLRRCDGRAGREIDFAVRCKHYDIIRPQIVVRIKP